MEINAGPISTPASDCCCGPPTASPVLLENDVHLWYSSLDLSASSYEQLEATLDRDERRRAKRFCFELERARFVSGRGLLRRILGYYSGIEPGELQFNYNSRGKPSLRDAIGGDKILFNLAHSDGNAIYAVALNREIGVDLERIVRIGELEHIAHRFFSDKEKTALHALTGNAKREAFFKIWTAKEAYLKACGKGLAHLDKIDVLLDPGRSTCKLKIKGDIRENSRWSVKLLRPAPRFTAALVVEGSNYRLAYCQWPEHKNQLKPGTNTGRINGC